MINKIFNDDCFSVFPLIAEKSVDLVVVDLPYGQTCCEWDKKIDLEQMWKQLERIGKDNCQYVFFTTTKFGIELIISKPKWFRYDLVWEKNNSVGFLSAKKMPLRKHEMIYVFSNPSKKGKVYNPQKTKGEPYINKRTNKLATETYGNYKNTPTENLTGDRYPTSILHFNHNHYKNRIHPTQKPIELCEWLVKTYSNENDLVLDFCMGSGSTIKACINTNRNYIGVEMDKEIFDKAEKSIIEHLGTKKEEEKI